MYGVNESEDSPELFLAIGAAIVAYYVSNIFVSHGWSIGIAFIVLMIVAAFFDIANTKATDDSPQPEPPPVHCSTADKYED